MDYKYYLLSRGYYNSDDEFVTDSWICGRGLDVADMLSNVAKTDGDFFAGYKGVIWKEITKGKVNYELGVDDCDVLFDKTYKDIL